MSESELKELLETFIVHSNGLSRYFRIKNYQQGLSIDLLKDIEDMYNFQCLVEDKLSNE